MSHEKQLEGVNGGEAEGFQPAIYSCGKPKDLERGRQEVEVTFASDSIDQQRHVGWRVGSFGLERQMDADVTGTRTTSVTARVVLSRGKGWLGNGERHIEEATLVIQADWSNVREVGKTEVTERSIVATQKLRTEEAATVTAPLAPWVGKIAKIVAPQEQGGVYQFVLPNVPAETSTAPTRDYFTS